MTTQSKRTYYVGLPDGGMALLGSYASETSARAAMTRKLPADYRQLCSGPHTGDDVAGEYATDTLGNAIVSGV